MTHVRQILLTALLVLTAVSVALLAGCDERYSLSYSGSSYRSGGSYPHSTSYRPARVHSPSRTVYIGSGSVHHPGRISRTHIRSYPRVHRPLPIHRGSRYSGHRSPRTGHSGGSHGSSGSRGHR